MQPRGEAAWKDTRYLRFDFAVDRTEDRDAPAHTWDKWTGRYRVEGKDRDGRARGRCDEPEHEGRRGDDRRRAPRRRGAREALEAGYALVVNDTYWLLMPYKMRDPGVVLSLAGTEKKGEDRWDKVRLTFEGSVSRRRTGTGSSSTRRPAWWTGGSSC